MNRPVQRRVLGSLVATQIVGALGVGTGVAVGALVTASVSGSVALGGLGSTATALGAAILSVPTAVLATRYGRRRALATAYGVGAFGACLAAFAAFIGSWQFLVLALVFFGGGTTANLAARYAATDLASPAHRARALSTVVWSTTVGAVVGPNFAEPATRLAGNAGPFLLAAAAFGLAAAGIAAGLRPDPLEPTAVGPVLGDSCCGVGGFEVPTRAAGAEVWTALGPTARLAVFGVVLCNTAMVGMMSMTPVRMNHGGSSLTVVGVVISLHIAAMYGASPLLGWLADRLGRMPVLTLGAALVVAASGISGMAGSHDAPQMAVGMVMLGCGWSAGVVAGSTLLTESVPVRLRPATQGFADLLMNAGGALGGLTAGIIVQAWSYPALGLIVGFIALPFLMACMVTTLRDPVADRQTVP